MSDGLPYRFRARVYVPEGFVRLFDMSTGRSRPVGVGPAAQQWAEVAAYRASVLAAVGVEVSL